MPRAGIALGSNLGERPAHIRAAIKHLIDIAVPGEVVLIAPIYQSEPRFCPPGSPPFLNTVIEIAFDGEAIELLELTQIIEQKLGRVRGQGRNEPRVIDIDLLYLGAETLDQGTLILPHPRIGERRFVLQPLADIRPDLKLPGRNPTIKEMLSELQSDEAPLIHVSMRLWRPDC